MLSVLLSALVKRFNVSRMRDFFKRVVHGGLVASRLLELVFDTMVGMVVVVVVGYCTEYNMVVVVTVFVRVAI